MQNNKTIYTNYIDISLICCFSNIKKDKKYI